MKNIFPFFFKSVLVLSISSVLFSCRGEKQKESNIRDGAATIQGDKEKCKLTSTNPAGQSPLIGTWLSLDWEEKEDLRFTYAATFVAQNNSTTLLAIFTNYCSVKSLGRSVAAEDKSESVDKITSFILRKDLVAEKTENFGEQTIKCDLDIKAGEYRYNFDGSCLVIEGRYFVKKSN